ncbi:hypothetical protein E6W36_11795 [Hankyongella ginsenosidimutans]|uniref:Uncharacterized protein n=1 Tax=Hankyongella ginsenosidimutans TaxID=1763828 RepID=A0A4D7CC84_9SPHN|nr:hypothetical protein E6W36_11795 [Hankyongella ginsenosidimutans]
MSSELPSGGYLDFEAVGIVETVRLSEDDAENQTSQILETFTGPTGGNISIVSNYDNLGSNFTAADDLPSDRAGTLF